MRQPISDEINTKIANSYIFGMNVRKLAKECGVSPAHAYKILLKKNIKLPSQSESKRKYTLNINYFNEIDSPEKAYFLGWLFSDGCNMPHKNVVKIALHKKDEKMLYKLRDLIGSNIPLSYYTKDKTIMACLNLWSGELSQKLLEKGLIPRKSLTLEFPKYINDMLIKFFIRGFSDGNGHIGICNRKNRTSKQYSWEIFTTKNVSENIEAIIKERVGINCHSYSKRGRKNTYFMVGGNKQVVKALDWLYSDRIDLSLERKYQKYIQMKNGL